MVPCQIKLRSLQSIRLSTSTDWMASLIDNWGAHLQSQLDRFYQQDLLFCFFFWSYFFVSPANCHQPETRAVGHPCNPYTHILRHINNSFSRSP